MLLAHKARPFTAQRPVQTRRRVEMHAAASPSTPLQTLAAGAMATTSALVMLLNPLPASANTLLEGPARAVDGDTLYIGSEKIRLYAVDAPESKQQCSDRAGKPYACGQISAQALASKIQNQVVTCVVKNKDQYGRNVAACKVGGEDIGGWMVKNGQAVAYKQYGGQEYAPLESQAQAARVGIWQGSFEVPSDWRKEQKGIPVANPAGGAYPPPPAAVPVATPRSVATLPPGPCPKPTIKGNISAKGEKIYHVPGGTYYDAVKIDLDQGERLFCSEAEAVAAGWRPSAR